MRNKTLEVYTIVVMMWILILVAVTRPKEERWRYDQFLQGVTIIRTDKETGKSEIIVSPEEGWQSIPSKLH